MVLPDSSQNAAPPHTTPSVTTPTTPTVTEPEDSGSQEASLPQTVEEEPAETVQPVEEDPVPAVFTWPVKGEILSGFSLEVLAYDETMGDWRTHSGVDIAASVGTNVLAISAGTVQGVYDDDLMGTWRGSGPRGRPDQHLLQPQRQANCFGGRHRQHRHRAGRGG